MSKKRTKWTRERDLELVRLISNGLTANRAGAKMKVSESSVVSRLIFLGLSARSMRKALDEGRSFEQILALSFRYRNEAVKDPKAKKEQEKQELAPLNDFDRLQARIAHQEHDFSEQKKFLDAVNRNYTERLRAIAGTLEKVQEKPDMAWKGEIERLDRRIDEIVDCMGSEYRKLRTYIDAVNRHYIERFREVSEKQQSKKWWRLK